MKTILTLRRISTGLARRAATDPRLRALLVVCFLLFCAQAAQAQLSVTPSTWNVIGLDSNDVTAGPDTFISGVRVCNTSGTTLTNVTGQFVWDSFNQYISLANQSTVTIPTLAAASCTEIFFNVRITRTALAYNAARRYHITVSADNAASVSTPTPREIYVEKLVSQARNETRSLTGPTSVTVGQTYTYVMTGKTAPGGYEQLVNFLTFSNSIFQVISISTNYTAPTGGTNNQTYADACGWQNNPTLANYRACVGPANYAGGKAGGDIQTTYTVKIIGSGAVVLDSIIYDFSGSSYHYGSSVSPLNVTAYTPPNIGLTKSASSTTVRPGQDIVYTINFNNSGDLPASSFIVVDIVPSNTVFKVGSMTYNLGTTGLAAPVMQATNVSLPNPDPTQPPLPPPAADPSWGYVPTGTYDTAVKFVRWRFNTGTIPAGTSGSVSFTVRVP